MIRPNHPLIKPPSAAADKMLNLEISINRLVLKICELEQEVMRLVELVEIMIKKEL